MTARAMISVGAAKQFPRIEVAAATTSMRVRESAKRSGAGASRREQRPRPRGQTQENPKGQSGEDHA